MLIVDCLQFCADILIVLPQNERNESSDNVQLLDSLLHTHTQTHTHTHKKLYIWYVIQEKEAI